MIPFFIFVLGLLFGSFINALVYRLHTEQPFVRARSHCPHCKHTLGWLDLIPVLSWLTLKGNCRYCRLRISIQYPLVELATGLSFLLVYLAGPTTSWLYNLQLATWLIFTVFLIIIFIYDLKYYLILDQIVLPAAVIAFILNIFLGISWWVMLLSGLMAGGFFLVQYLVSGGTWIGGGDIRLGFLMGLMLSWPATLAALFLAYVGGSIVGLALIAFSRKSWGSQVPFGTFLTAATFITMLYGRQLIDWYLGYFYV